MEVASVLVSVLLAAFSLPFLLLLLVLAEAGLRLAALALRRGGRYAWPTRSAFLGYRIARSAEHLSAAALHDEAPLPPECCDRLAVALYRHGACAGEEPEAGAGADCVFCLSRIEDGEEVRELRCRHVFHRACLDAWLVRPRATCPLCRDRLLPSEPSRACANAVDDHDLDLSSSSAVAAAAASYSHGAALWHM